MRSPSIALSVVLAVAVLMAGCAKRTSPLKVENGTANSVYVLIAPSPHSYALGMPASHDFIFSLRLAPGESWESSGATDSEREPVRLINGQLLVMYRAVPHGDPDRPADSWTEVYIADTDASAVLIRLAPSADGTVLTATSSAAGELPTDVLRSTYYDSEVKKLRLWRDSRFGQ
ncbi:MAG: hypothetical protein KDA05_12745 [Phycisphaerales bacterium]|nr:hypothetical protein [Phycisphaerales bacterium]